MVFTTTKFRSLTDQVASTLGLPGARIVEVGHPLGGTDPETIESWADDAVEQTLQLLTSAS